MKKIGLIYQKILFDKVYFCLMKVMTMQVHQSKSLCTMTGISEQPPGDSITTSHCTVVDVDHVVIIRLT
jgi:hypothetical protein